MRSLSINEYTEVSKEYYNEVLESDSISTWFSPDYYAFDDTSRGQIWY